MHLAEVLSRKPTALRCLPLISAHLMRSAMERPYGVHKAAAGLPNMLAEHDRTSLQTLIFSGIYYLQRNLSTY